MNIRLLTLHERERLAYIENRPDKGPLGELVDIEHELLDTKDALVETEWRLEELEEAGRE